MAEIIDGLTEEEAASAAELPADHPVLKALRATRSELRGERALRHIADLKAAHPDLGLTPEDFKGLTPDEFEARVTRLAALKGTATPPTPPPTTDEQELIVEPQRTAFERMQQPVEGTPPTGGGPMISVQQAFALRKSDPAEFERLKAEGRIKDWPKMSDQGGRVTFSR